MINTINTLEIVKAFINSNHGWAVADQFENTFSDPSEENFSEQNINALNYILYTVKDLIRSEVLSEDVTEELRDYYKVLNDYSPK